MIIYVETTFLLDLALKQEHCKESSKILEAIEKKRIPFRLPSMCVLEAQSKVDWRKRQKDKIAKESIQKGLQEIAVHIGKTVETEQKELRNTIRRVLRSATLLNLNAAAYRRSWIYVRSNEIRLQPVDALILSTVVEDMTRSSGEDKVFLTYDHDFDKDEIRRRLKKLKTGLALSARECLTSMVRS